VPCSPSAVSRPRPFHAIAHSAQVSPNLITRYFGGKDGLFLAATDVRFDLAAAFDGPQSSFGERVAHNLVARWAELGVNDPLPILLRSAGGQPTAASALADFLSENNRASPHARTDVLRCRTLK
jgi:AcrR family transcriptional regulator